MKTKFKLYMVAFFCLFIPITAFANIEVKSENIIFYGDVKEKEAQRLVRNLEIYRAVILTLSKVKNRPDDVPLRIYAFKNGSQLNKFAESRGIAGLYKDTPEGPIFLTVSAGGFKKNRWSSQVALHEYSHHVLHALSKDSYPRWYDEGFANYLSTFMIDGDVVTIGSPNVSHGLSLKKGPWLDPETVLGAIHRYPTTRRIDKFYGQSWVYVHYMQNTPELSAKLPDYLKLLKEKKDPLQAFETGFGLSVEEFHKRARVYWNKNLFSVASFKATPELLDHDMDAREMSDAAFDFAYAKTKTNFLKKKDAIKFADKYDDLEATLGDNQDLYLMISQAAMMGEDYKRAKTYLTKAIKTGKINSQLLHQRADLAYHKLVSEQFEDMPDDAAKIFKTDKALAKAVQYFEEAFMLKEGNRTIDMHLLDLLGRSSSPVSDASMKAVERNYNLHLKPNNVGEYISVANVMARQGQKIRACDNYTYAKGRVEGYEDKTKNDDAARLIKFEQDFLSLCE